MSVEPQGMRRSTSLLVPRRISYRPRRAHHCDEARCREGPKGSYASVGGWKACGGNLGKPAPLSQAIATNIRVQWRALADGARGLHSAPRVADGATLTNGCPSSKGLKAQATD